jgi:hypothetical protein
MFELILIFYQISFRLIKIMKTNHTIIAYYKKGLSLLLADQIYSEIKTNQNQNQTKIKQSITLKH